MREFGAFFLTQVKSSIFPLAIFTLLAITLPLDFGRYEVLLVACLAIQWWMVKSGWETADEIATICVFHGAGLALEIYKVHHGSWTYPEPSITKIFDVPVFSGFMYAAVASYIIQAWRRFDLKMTAWPAKLSAAVVVLAIYANFYTNRIIGDYRWLAVGAVVLVFWKTTVEFTTLPGKRRRMPMLVAFLLMGFFVYVGENICSALGAYVYPHQVEIWKPVSLGKLSSWSLLVIFSTLLVKWLKDYKKREVPATETECVR